ncbi:MAG TPA: DUF192 domain-containing protein [Chromatiales bacterium]|nr:DUF192 domain-containing protein [Chromatiales bacterium]
MKQTACKVAMLTATSLFTGSAALAVEPAGLLRDFDTATAVFETSHNNCIRLNIWLADTPARQQQGLMFIRHMDRFEGMLFRYPRDAVLRMWMKNTFIPLDMVFIDSHNDIIRIEANTEPLSERTISSRNPVRSVLELNAGSAGKWGLQPGNRLLLVDARGTG